MSNVTIDSEAVIASADLSKYERDLEAIIDTEDITEKSDSVQLWVQRQLAARGWSEADVQDPTELKNLAAYRWLYEYYRDAETHGSSVEGFKGKADRYKEDYQEEIELLFTMGGLTAADTADPQPVPTKVRMLTIG